MKVKIKSWDRMEKEFGLDEDGNIDTSLYYFMDTMEEELPSSRIIEVTQDSNYDEEYVWETKYNSWMISEDMIEEIIEGLINDK